MTDTTSKTPPTTPTPSQNPQEGPQQPHQQANDRPCDLSCGRPARPGGYRCWRCYASFRRHGMTPEAWAEKRRIARLVKLATHVRRLLKQDEEYLLQPVTGGGETK